VGVSVTFVAATSTGCYFSSSIFALTCFTPFDRPYLTGWGMLADDEDMYFDGGFSRLLHPECESRLDLPITWDFVIHTFSPGLTSGQISHLWRAGSRFDYSLPKRAETSPADASRTIDAIFSVGMEANDTIVECIDTIM
jgi:hypothetical protein